ncbi:MAG TPA: type II toxin-antitoxin system HicB family antitoxin [Phycisphaerae bacterium]|nr:type II toxin-antitoxin system HicB family antitoxin [Phycisphaerae bacterium]HUU21150.1 type II toxin-antitoxin system HicB family antitoxin [Phycisphaerae bacterium]
MKLCVRICKNIRGEYTATCPSLPGCTSRGQTEEQAKAKLEEAIHGYLASVNNFVPEKLEEFVEYRV